MADDRDPGPARPPRLGGRVASLGRRVLVATREEWATGRLSLADLDPWQRRHAGLAIVASLTACALLLIGSAGVQVPGQVVEVQGRLLASRSPVAVPTLLVLLACVGLAIAASAIALAALEPDGRPARRMTLVLALVLAGLGGNIFASLGAFDFHHRLIGDAGDVAVSAYRTTGMLAFAAALLLPAFLFVRRPIPRAVVAIVAAMPFVGLLLTILLAGDAHGVIDPWTQAQNLDYPSTLYLNATLYGPLFFVLDTAAALLAVLALWQLASWSRASVRQVGLRVAAATERHDWLLPVLVTLKMAWLLLGGLLVLPAMLGGTAPGWAALRSDDSFSWAYAAVLGAGAMAWLLSSRARVDERPALRVAGRVAIAFAAVPIALAVLPILTSALVQISPTVFPPTPERVTIALCVNDWAPHGGAALLTCMGHVLVAWQSVWWALLVAAALIVGLVWARRQPGSAGPIFLAVLGAWVLPRAIDTIARIPPPELDDFASRLPRLDAPQPETLDVVVTVLVLVLAVGWWVGWQRRVGPRALIVILVASTLLVHSGTLLPAATTAFWLAIPLVFPVLYELGFDSESLNATGRPRSGRVLAALGIRAFALTLLATVVVVDLTRLRESSGAAIGLLFFGIPLAATIVAATVRTVEPVSASTPRTGRTALRRPAIATIVGLAAFGLVALGAAAVEPRVAHAYPTGSSRLAELEARMEVLAGELVEVGAQPDDPAHPASLLESWRRETRWLGEHPPPGCAVDAWSIFRDVVDDVRDFSILLAATGAPPASAPEAEIAAVQENLFAVFTTLLERAAALEVTLATARPTCAEA